MPSRDIIDGQPCDPLTMPTLSLNADVTATGGTSRVGLGAGHAPAFQSRGGSQGGGAKADSKTSSSPSIGAISQHFIAGWAQLQTASTPRLYIGELQVTCCFAIGFPASRQFGDPTVNLPLIFPFCLQIHFLSTFIRLLTDAPVHLRGAFKRTTFFQRHPSWPQRFSPALKERLRNAPEAPTRTQGAFAYDDQGKGPVQLLTKLDINATSDVLEIHHDAQVRLQAPT